MVSLGNIFQRIRHPTTGERGRTLMQNPNVLTPVREIQQRENPNPQRDHTKRAWRRKNPGAEKLQVKIPVPKTTLSRHPNTQEHI